MAEPYIGEIRLSGFSFAPVGWNFCDGTILQIADYQALYQLIGTTYGGDGVNTFGVPDLRSRFPLHQGSNYVLGQLAGTTTVTLTAAQMPSHSHALMAQNGAANQSSPAGNCFANTAASSVNWYTTNAPIPADNLAASAVTPAG